MGSVYFCKVTGAFALSHFNKASILFDAQRVGSAKLQKKEILPRVLCCCMIFSLIFSNNSNTLFQKQCPCYIEHNQQL